MGEIDSSNVLLLDDAFWLAGTYGCAQTYLDLTDLTFISSAGLGQIIHAIGDLKDNNSEILIGRMSEAVSMALTSIGLDRFVKFQTLAQPASDLAEVYGIIVPGELSELKTVRDFLEDSFKRIHYEEIAGYGVKMAVDELVSNVIRHNYSGATGKPITVLLSRGDGLLEASVIDQGFEFDPTAYESRGFGATIQGGHNNGMGISLVRTLSDSFVYKKGEGGHNIAQLSKKIKE